MMEKNWLTKSSFLFGNVDMYQKFGLQITQDGLPQDVLIPYLRARKRTIPLRHGTYDYGAQYYDERPVPWNLVTTKVLTREDTREIAYVLSKKTEIRFWNEPDKYYIGRIYEAPPLEVIRNTGNRFPVIFVCEPFAYRNTYTKAFENNRFIPNYQGTAPTPTYIVIDNVGRGNAVTIQITQTNRKENY